MDESKIYKWEFFFIFLLILYYVLPVIQDFFPFGIGTLFGALYALYIARSEKGLSESLYKLLVFSIFISLIYLLFTETNSIGSNVTDRSLKRIVSKYDQVFNLFFPAFIGCRVALRASVKQKKMLLFTFFVCFAIVIFQTIKAMQIYPNITRSFENRSEEELEMYSSLRSIGLTNIGSFYFVYSVPFIVVVFLSFFLNESRLWGKILALFILTELFSFIIKSQFSLAFLITIIGLSLMLYATSRSSNTRSLSVVVLILFVLVSPILLSQYASQSSSALMSTRLTEVSDFIQLGDKSGDNLSGRLDLYWRSIVAFFNSPIIGNRHLDFDGHATFLTYLSDVGLLGSIPFFYLFRISYKSILHCIRIRKEEFRVLFIMIILMGMTNPIVNSYSIPLCLWFVSPLILSYIYERNTRLYD